MNIFRNRFYFKSLRSKNIKYILTIEQILVITYNYFKKLLAIQKERKILIKKLIINPYDKSFHDTKKSLKNNFQAFFVLTY